MLGNRKVGAALVGLAVVGSEVEVNIVTFSEGDYVATEEGEPLPGNMGVGAATGGCWLESWGQRCNICQRIFCWKSGGRTRGGQYGDGCCTCWTGG